MSATVKYPRTPHLPFSPGVSSDDVVLDERSAACFANRRVVVTEKLDGGNCCLWNGHVFARSHGEEASHPSFSHIKGLIQSIQQSVSDYFGEATDIQLFGENMFAVHSVEYDRLTSYFYLFAILRDKTEWLSWNDVQRFAVHADLPTVPLAFEGEFASAKHLRDFIETRAAEPSAMGSTKPEGFVVRVAESYHADAFERCIAKFVRANHIQTDSTWRRTWKTAKLVDMQ